MAQPVWITPAGSLGTIPEGVFYQTPLQAFEPELGETVYFEVIAGQLPSGIQVSATGLLAGVPQAIASVQGVPTEVSGDITSKFAVRAYTRTTVNGVTVINRLADRTFSITVTGQDTPEFLTPAGSLGSYFDGTQITDLQIEYTDTDPADNVVVKLVAGILPPGLTVSATGLISGFLQPNAVIEATAGYSRDGQGYDEYPYDFATQSSSTNYEFTLEVTDGKASNIRNFSIFVYSQNTMTADNTEVTADNTFITADVTPVRTPILLNTPGNIGTVRNDNFFAYKFNGLDLDGDPISYAITAESMAGLPPGLTLDPTTGWWYGYIPNLGLTDRDYEIGIRVFKTNNPTVISEFYYFSLNIVGALDTEVTWLTDSDLGTIVNGSTSTLYVEAVNRGGKELLYQLRSGSDSSLPQGLQLLESGEIAGRVSFNTFAVDSGETTFDVSTNDLAITGEDTKTTFDLKYTFTVNAYSADGLISVFKTFSVTVDREYNEPYENLYIQAMPPQQDRSLISSFIQNSEIFPPSLIYRYNDPNFGIAKNVVYNHAFGLTASTIADYYSSLYENHYWKNLVLGSIETAQALDDDGNVLYEVVYSRVIDNLLNDQGQSVSKEVRLPYPINEGDSTEVDVVYPNSLINMRDQVIDVVGQIANILPRWMISKQADGRVLGFTPAWVIAYCKPGKSGQVQYNIREQFGIQLNKIDFEVDRYELDRLLTKNWDPVADSTVGAWEPTPAATTFDIEPHYQLPERNDSSFVFDGGIDYAVGDQIRILGSQVGGQDGINDITLTVNTVDSLGTIESAFCQGFAPLLTVGDTYTNVIGTNITPGSIGSGATWDIEVVGEDPTTFDGNSLKFIAPVDMYSNTTDFDKYLVFPKRTILG
jgi:hypothetical protein